MKKNILVTGGTGFIGSHLSEKLVEMGYSVKVFDRYNINNDWGWLEESKFKNDIDVVLGDIRDFDSVTKAMRGCDAVFHLAALIGIPYSYISPKAYIETNIVGTYNVLESAKNHNINEVLITSTSETYGTAQYVPIDENHPLVGQSPYSASKIAADQLAISYFKSFEMPIKIVRPFNTYGPRQSARAIIPTVIGQILNQKGNIKLGNLSPTRDLTFVEDTCNGFLQIYNCDKLYGEVTNIGVSDEISIKKLIQKIARLMNSDVIIESDESRIRPSNSEVERLFSCNKKLLKNTNWKPHYDLDRGLNKTIKWIQENIDIFKTEKYNV